MEYCIAMPPVRQYSLSVYNLVTLTIMIVPVHGQIILGIVSGGDNLTFTNSVGRLNNPIIFEDISLPNVKLI